MSLLPKALVWSPGRVLVLSLLSTILVGTLLLLLPWCHVTPGSLSLLDIFFTATSATCVTSLLTVPLSLFTWWGQLVILLLIQIGGLGVVTLTSYLIFLFFEMTMGMHFLLGHVLELQRWGGMRRLITFIITVTLLSELIGAFLFWLVLPFNYQGLDRIWYALFHAISSFCNAGFVIIPGELLPLRNAPLFLLITSLLVFLGGFGFVSLQELIAVGYAKFWQERRVRISLHTKIVTLSALIITVVATVLFLLFEYDRNFIALSWGNKVVNALFTSVCSRSAGFTTLNLVATGLPTLFVIMIIAFIGSAPGSTGSGIRTTTVALFIAAVQAVMRGRLVIEMKGRRIPHDQVLKAMAILVLGLMWIITGTLLMLMLEPEWGFTAIVFEVISAFANLGLSLGITPFLSGAGKWCLIVLMIVGRIGSLTILLALKKRHEGTDFRYPEERVLLT